MGKVYLRGRLRAAVEGPLALGVLLLILNIALYAVDVKAGALVSIFLAVYIVFAVLIHVMGTRAIFDEMRELAYYYEQGESGFLDKLSVPYAILASDGKILWMNSAFCSVTGKDSSYHKSVAAIFSSLSKEYLSRIEESESVVCTLNEGVYRAFIQKAFLNDFMGRLISQEFEDEDRQIFTLLLADKTKQVEFERLYMAERMAVALVFVDNYDEVTERMESVKSSLLMALVERKLSRYFKGDNVLVQRFDNDRYIVVFRQDQIDGYREDKFGITEMVKEVRVGNEMSVTLSIGVGAGADTYKENYAYARAAIDLALGRGGDQVVIKDKDEIEYFGGKTRQVDKLTRVKARIKAQALYEVMQTCDDVVIMGHHIGDVDSFGASIGIYRAAMTMGKRARIVIDEVTSSIRPMKDLFTEANGYPGEMFLSEDEAVEAVGKNTMVMVVDVNRPGYTECPALLEKSENIVVFDHHRHGADTISNAVLSYIEPYASSTCEMVTEVLQYFSEEVKLTTQEADSIYAGIIIDTNNFMTKTGVRTFEAAAFLRRKGADVTRVRKLLQNDMEAYRARAETVRNAEVYRGCFAISVFPNAKVESPTVAGAQAANELLNIIGIKASFVLTQYHDMIYISSRSIDEIDVQLIMNRCGGGGHLNMAGAQLKDMTMDEAIAHIKDILDGMIEKGDIKL